MALSSWVATAAGSLIGPEAATAAEVRFGDLVATAVQVLIVAGCVALLRGWPRLRTRLITAVPVRLPTRS